MTATLTLAACGGDDATLVGYAIEPAPDVSGLTLPDVTVDGQPFEFTADPGTFDIVFFGYTHCPDVCPLTLSEIRRALTELDQPGAVGVAMVSVDPARDTPALLGEYVTSFVEGAHGLRTDDPAELRTVADRFGVSYAVTDNGAGGIDVTHTGNVFVVGDDGTVALVWPNGTSGDDMADDLAILLDG